MYRSLLVFFFAAFTLTQSWSQKLPPPTSDSQPCTTEQEAAALVALDIDRQPQQCYLVHRYSFRGVALILPPEPALLNIRNAVTFAELRREVRETQFQRLQREREASARSSDGFVSHMTLPRTLNLLAPSPIGIFYESNSAIAMLDLLPVRREYNDSSPKRELGPLARADVIYLANDSVGRLVLYSMAQGIATVRDIYRITEDWLGRIDQAKHGAAPAR
jgi:hypothetical protein